MDLALKAHVQDRWSAHFPGAELPIVLYYTNDSARAQPPLRPSAPSHPCTTAPPPPSPCLICDLAAVRQGASRRFDAQTISCGGARRYLGFDPRIRPNFAHFLSCGIPGEIEGERYKQSPQLVEAYLENQPPFVAPGRFIVFKRWDRLDAEDDPAVVVFFAPPDVLSGLFTLANFDEADPHAVVAPFGAGCASIVYHPYRQLSNDRPRAVLGMFDVSARPCVPPDVLTFAVPWPRFARMAGNIQESFLITDTWRHVRARIRERRP